MLDLDRGRRPYNLYANALLTVGFKKVCIIIIHLQVFTCSINSGSMIHIKSHTFSQVTNKFTSNIKDKILRISESASQQLIFQNKYT